MFKLLYIEWLKVKSYKTFRVLIGCFILLLPLWNYGISDCSLKLGNTGGINLFSQAYSFSGVWQNIGFWTSYFSILIALLIIIVTTNEFQFKTHRQNIIDGWERLDFFHAKWGLVGALSLCTTIFVFILGVLFGLKYGHISNFPGEIKYLFYTFILTLNYYSFALLVAFFFKRTGISIGALLIYSIVLESLIGKIINWQIKGYWGNFLPLQCSDELLPFPMLEIMKGAFLNPDNAAPSNTTYLIVSIGWIVVYYFVGRWKLLKSDW